MAEALNEEVDKVLLIVIASAHFRNFHIVFACSWIYIHSSLHISYIVRQALGLI
jgi:hypothetical protein